MIQYHDQFPNGIYTLYWYVDPTGASLIIPYGETCLLNTVAVSARVEFRSSERRRSTLGNDSGDD